MLEASPKERNRASPSAENPQHTLKGNNTIRRLHALVRFDEWAKNAFHLNQKPDNNQPLGNAGKQIGEQNQLLDKPVVVGNGIK